MHGLVAASSLAALQMPPNTVLLSELRRPGCTGAYPPIPRPQTLGDTSRNPDLHNRCASGTLLAFRAAQVAWTSSSALTPERCRNTVGYRPCLALLT